MAKRHEVYTVLIVEDEPDIQNFISRVLELEGYRVIKAADGVAGLELMKHEPIDLLLLDLRLPVLDGWSVLKKIKGDRTLSKIPVVVVSAVAEPTQRQKTLNLGVAYYLVKPLSAHSISRTVAGILYKKAKHFPLADRYAVSHA